MLWIAIKGAVIGAIYVGAVSYIGTSALLAFFDITLNHSRDAAGITQRALRSRASLFVACVAAFFGALGGAVVLTFKR